MRTAREIREDIESQYGFFPPFFAPAEDNPAVLENLWQQTCSAYRDNPIPALVREKLFAYLSRYCAVPYCIVCHACALRPMGLKAEEVLALLEAPLPAHGALDETLVRMDAQDRLPGGWPEPGSVTEDDVFHCAILLFVHGARAERCQERLRRLLSPTFYGHLIAFLAYVKTCHLWVEVHPELGYEADARAREHLGPLLREEPRLGEFFAHYRERVRDERERRELRLLAVAEAGHRAESLAETLRQQTEALRESETHLRLALESAALGIWDHDLGTGELRWDARCRALLGVSAEAAVDFPVFLECLLPEDRKRVEADIQQAMRLESGGELRTEYRIRGIQDGVERRLASRGRCFFDEQGRPVRLIGTVMDITERQRAEHNLRLLAQSGELLAASLDYEDTLRRLASLVVPVLADGCTVDVLDTRGGMSRLVFLHRFPEKTRVGEELERRYPRHNDSPAGAARVMRTGTPELVTHIPDEGLARYAQDAEHLRLLRKLGVHSYLVVPLRSRERVLGAITLIRTEPGLPPYGQEELRLAEELARRAALAVDNALLYAEAQRAIGLRDGFLQVAAHELRTPVTVLKLNAQALLASARREAAWTEKTRSRVESLERSVSRLSVLVGELLDVSLITSGRLVLHPEEVDLSALVRETLERLRPEAERAGCALRVEVPGAVVGGWDRLRLEQVLGSLLSNALKYGAGQPVQVVLSATDSRVVLRVRDEGIGIDPAVQPRIFDRFVRAVSDRNYGGLGMGLWMTREILTAMGGTIHVQSAPGKGATFTVELPRAPLAPSPSGRGSG